MTCKVYGLFSTEDNSVRYIGQTKVSVDSRLLNHRRRSKDHNTHLYNWMRKVHEEGYEVEAVVLLENAEWNTDEIRIIAEYRSRGVPLVNSTDGGDGVLNPPEDVRRRISESMSSRVYDEEARKRLSDGHKGKPLRKAHRDNMVASVKKTYAERGKEISEKLSAMRKGVPKSEEHKEKIRQAHIQRCERKRAGL